MVTFILTCDECGREFHEASENCIDEAIGDLKHLDSECDTGDKMLCPECMDEHQQRLAAEDERQFWIAKGLA